ncbi:hypothetical protein [Bacillus thuringiensis]|nr:hypothetical protein [Bacillus thuringiensis]
MIKIRLSIEKDAWGVMFGYYVPERTLGIHILCFYCNISFE